MQKKATMAYLSALHRRQQDTSVIHYGRYSAELFEFFAIAKELSLFGNNVFTDPLVQMLC